jgi:RHS repeat-associated protein
VFSSLTPAPAAPTASFEGDSNDAASQYLNVNATNVVSFGSANHTTGGSKVVRMNQTYKTGPARSIHVYPGDKVDIEVWEYHEGTSGFGTTSTPISNLITNVAAAFGGVSGAAGESGAIYNGVNSAVTAFGTGGNRGDAQPAAYVNYILFDKNYNVLDAGWQLAPATTFTKQKLSFPTKQIKEEGYIYTWLSYDDDSNNFAYFDDFKVTHTKTNVIQYNDYYPFGLQASTSWTRDNSKNNFLYNEASELNSTSGFYDLPYRNYDAALGRFFQVDPMAEHDHTLSPFVYGGNNPIVYNDPTGLMRPYIDVDQIRAQYATVNLNPGMSFDGNHQWSDYWETGGGGGGSGSGLGGSSTDYAIKDALEALGINVSIGVNGGVSINGSAYTATGNGSNGYWHETMTSYVDTDGQVTVESGMSFVPFQAQQGGPGLYTNERDALNALWGLGNYNEAGMFVTDRGYLVLPTSGVKYNGTKFINESDKVHWDVYPIGSTDGVMEVIYNDESLKILATMHTHPHPKEIGPSPEDFVNSVTFGTPHFTIGPNYVWIGQAGGAPYSGLIIGKSSDFLNGNKSLYQWIGK